MKHRYILAFILLIGIIPAGAQKMLVHTKTSGLKEYDIEKNTEISFSSGISSIKPKTRLKPFMPEFRPFLTSSNIAFHLKLSPFSEYKLSIFNLCGRRIFLKEGDVGASGCLDFSEVAQLSHGLLIIKLDSKELSFSRKMIILR